MTTFHAGKDSVWKALRRLTVGDGQLDAAIAWIADASLLRVKAGDRIVVDASVEAIRSRSTSALAIKAMIDHEAEVWSLPGLHAKTMVIDGATLIAGSMNASVRSDRHLVEAAIETDDRRAVVQALNWLAHLRKKATSIDSGHLNDLLNVDLDPPARLRPIAGTRIPETGGDPSKPKQYWLFTTYADVQASPHTKKGDATMDREASKPKNKRSVYSYIQSPPEDDLAHRVRKEDYFFEAAFEDNHRMPDRVLEAATIWDVEPFEDGWKHIHFLFRRGVKARAISWARFKDLANDSGQKLGQPGWEFKIDDAAARRMIANWPIGSKGRRRRA